VQGQRRQADTKVSVGGDRAKKGESMPKNAASQESGGVPGKYRREQNGLSWLIDTLSGLVWTALPDGSIDFLNRGWQQYTGVPIERGCRHGWHAAIRYPG
jgi:PAS domain-containing protein